MCPVSIKYSPPSSTHRSVPLALLRKRGAPDHRAAAGTPTSAMSIMLAKTKLPPAAAAGSSRTALAEMNSGVVRLPRRGAAGAVAAVSSAGEKYDSVAAPDHGLPYDLNLPRATLADSAPKTRP